MLPFCVYVTSAYFMFGDFPEKQKINENKTQITITKTPVIYKKKVSKQHVKYEI